MIRESRLVASVILLLASNAAAQEALVPLAEYEQLSIRGAIERELDSATDALNDRNFNPEQRIQIRRFIVDLNAELGALNTLQPGQMPVATIARGANSIRYPSVGALLHNKETICSGTLTGSRAFITARHCFHFTKEPGDFVVFLQHGGLYSVSSINFPDNEELDIAVLELAERVDGIVPSGLPDAVTPPDKLKQIVGFGVTETHAQDSGIKRQGSVVTRRCTTEPDQHICWDFNVPHKDLSESNVCGRDSGGPVGIAVDEHLATEDGVSIRISPRLGCHLESQSWSTATFPINTWLESEIVALEPSASSGATIPVCCDIGVDVWGKEAVIGSGQRKDYIVNSTGDVRLVRVSLNAEDRPSLDLALDVWASGQHQDPRDCVDYGRYVSCEFEYAATARPDSWFVRVSHVAGGSAVFQLVVTMFEAP